TRRPLASGVAICLSMALWPVAADAQSPRAYTGLFGQRTSNAKRPQSFDFTMALVDGYDTGVDQTAASANRELRRDGGYSNLDTALRYTRSRGERMFTVSASDSLRYEPQLGDMLSSSVDGAVALVAPLGRQRRLSLSQSAGYTPYYQLQLFPALPPEAG